LLGRCFASVASGFVLLTLRLEREVIFLHSLCLMKKSGYLPLLLIVRLGSAEGMKLESGRLYLLPSFYAF